MKPVFTGRDQNNREVFIFANHQAQLDQTAVQPENVFPHPSLLPDLTHWRVRSLKRGDLLFYPKVLDHLVQAGLHEVKLTWKKRHQTLPLWSLFGCAHFVETLANFKTQFLWPTTATPQIELGDKFTKEAWEALVQCLQKNTRKEWEDVGNVPVDAALYLRTWVSDKAFPLLRAAMKRVLDSALQQKLTDENCVFILGTTLALLREKEKMTCLAFIRKNLFAKDSWSPLAMAISHKMAPATKELLSIARDLNMPSGDLVELALNTYDPEMIQIVLAAIDHKVLPSLLKPHQFSITVDAHPTRWEAIRQVCPNVPWLLGTPSKYVPYQVIRDPKAPWIKHFSKIGLYDKSDVLHYIVEKCGTQGLTCFVGAAKNIDPLLAIKKSDQTPFGAAMRAKRDEMAAALLTLHTQRKAPIDPNAFTQEHPRVIEAIVGGNLDIHKSDLLTWAIFLRPHGPDPRLAYRLLEAGADPNVTWDGESILQKLVKTSLFQMASYLIGKSLKKAVQHGAVKAALDAKRWDWIAYFAKHQIGLDWRDDQGRTLLHHAAAAGESDLCAALEMAGLDRWKGDVDGKTPFDLAPEFFEQGKGDEDG